MESEKDLMKPLKGELKNGGTENMNWMSRMRGDFLQRLPEKLKSGVDPEDPFNLDLSAAKGGNYPISPLHIVLKCLLHT